MCRIFNDISKFRKADDSKKVFSRILFLVFFFLFLSKTAWAYIDPGYGGYLISSFGVMVTGFFAFISALVIHFFREYVSGFFRTLWREQRAFFVVVFFMLAPVLIYALFFYRWVPAVVSGPVERSPAIFDPNLTGAFVRDPDRVSPGYNLYEGKLVDIRGRIVKTWSSVFLGTLDKNGDYYAQKYFQSPVWGRYTWDDKVVWEKKLPIHHQILLTPQNTVITLTKEMHGYKDRKVEFDVILEFDKEGKELRRFSTWEHLEDFYQYHGPLPIDRRLDSHAPDDFKKSPWGGNFDYYHMNFISLVPDNSLQNMNPSFEPGNWVISFRHGDMIFIVNPNIGKVVGHVSPREVIGGIQGVHATQMLSSGNLLVLDNGTHRRWSRVIELELMTKKIVWEYKAKDFFTYTQGHLQVLENGNMLVTESEKGHVFELTRDKKIVWEFYHPSRQNSLVSKTPLADCGLDADKIFEELIARGWLKPISFSEGMLTQQVAMFRRQLKKIFSKDFRAIYYVLTQYEKRKNYEYYEEIYRMRRYPAEMIQPLLRN